MALDEPHVVIGYASTPVGVYRRLVAIAAGWKLALCYYQAAKRDENAGFPFTAAMEWRKAAELFRLFPIARQRCWRQWERIMNLPRRFATPIVEGGDSVLQFALASNRGEVLTDAANDATLDSAA